MSFLRNIVSVFSTRVFARIFALGTTITIARVLGPAGQGKVSLALLVPLLLAQLVGLDFEVSNTYHTARKRGREGELIGNTIFYIFVVAPPSILLFILFYDTISETFLQNMDISLIYLALMILPISLLVSTLRGIILGEERFKLYNALVITLAGITFIFTFLFLVVFDKGVYEAILASLIGNFATLFILFLRFLIPRLKEIKLSLELLKKQISYGVKPYLANLFGLLNYRIDLLLVSYYLDEWSVGLYALAIGMVNRMQELPHSIQTVFFPKTTSQAMEEANVFTPILYRRTTVVIVFVSLIVGWLGWLLIPLIFGEEFSASIIPFLIFLLGRMIIRGSIGIISTDINGRGLPHLITLVSLLCLLTGVVLNLIAIPRWGIIGASVATSLTSVIQSVAVLLIYKKITGIPLRKFIPSFEDIVKIYERIHKKLSDMAKGHRI